MKYVLCESIRDCDLFGQVINEINIPLINEKGYTVIFDNELDARIERIFLQKNNIDILKIIQTNLGE